MIRQLSTSAGVVEFDDDPARVDRDAVWAFLSSEAYWGRWRARADLDRQLDGAWRVVAGYATEPWRASVPDDAPGDRRAIRPGELLCFARALSDGVALAYLADVFVDPRVRGAGLGKALVETMIEHGPGSDFRWTLHTKDAHGLYRLFGFTEPNETYLERPSRR
jgi:GNAT superfamily N-acetyltransferase